MSLNVEATSRAGRQRCYEARDVYNRCIAKQGLAVQPSSAVPDSCKHLRQAYEEVCLASWVRYFDQQEEASSRVARQLHQTINRGSLQTAGNLAGKP